VDDHADDGAPRRHLHRARHAGRLRGQYRHEHGQHLHDRHHQADRHQGGRRQQDGRNGRQGENGDTITFTYSEAIDPASVWSGWNGASTTVHLRLTDATGSHKFAVLDTSNGTTINLGSVATNGNYVTTTVTFNATMVRSSNGASIVVALGTPTSVQATAVTAKNMVWTVVAGIKDLAGNAITATTWTETDNKVDF
jgi:hypothetical protein